MAKILVFGVRAEELAKIKRAAGNIKLRVEEVPLILYRQEMGVLSEAKLLSLSESVQLGEREGIYEGTPIPESLIFMCGLSEKQLDKLLLALGQSEVKVDYKAVLTAENARWNVLRLLAELGREKAMYGQGLKP